MARLTFWQSSTPMPEEPGLSISIRRFQWLAVFPRDTDTTSSPNDWLTSTASMIDKKAVMFQNTCQSHVVGKILAIEMKLPSPL